MNSSDNLATYVTSSSCCPVKEPPMILPTTPVEVPVPEVTVPEVPVTEVPVTEVPVTEVPVTTTTTVMSHFCQKGLWLFILIAVIVLIVVGWLSRGSRGANGYWDSLEKWSWGNNDLIWFILMIIGVLLFAWAAWTAYASPRLNNSRRGLVAAGFAISMILIVVWFYLFFKKDESGNFTTDGIRTSFYIGIAASIVALLTLWPMWPAGNAVRIAMIPYLIWVIGATVLTGNIAENLGNDT